MASVPESTNDPSLPYTDAPKNASQQLDACVVHTSFQSPEVSKVAVCLSPLPVKVCVVTHFAGATVGTGVDVGIDASSVAVGTGVSVGVSMA